MTVRTLGNVSDVSAAMVVRINFRNHWAEKPYSAHSDSSVREVDNLKVDILNDTQRTMGLTNLPNTRRKTKTSPSQFTS